MPIIQPRAENIYIAGLCFGIAVICAVIILRGLIAGKPPMQKGIVGTSLENSKPLLYLQLALLAALGVATGTTSYFFIQAMP